MDREALARQLLAIYLEEVEEYVAAMNRDLLALEQATAAGRRAELIRNLFRAVHSLKGASHAVAVPSVADACHGLESVLAGVRDGERALTVELVELLFAAADAIGETAGRLRRGDSLEGAPLAGLLPRIAGLHAPGARAARSAGPEARLDGLPTQPVPEDRTVEAPIEAAVRVRADKLDVLLARTSELVVARARVEARAGEVAGLMDLLDRWEAELRAIDKPLRRLLGAGGGDAVKVGRGGATSGPRGGSSGVGRAYSPSRRVQLGLQRAWGVLQHMRRQVEQVAAGAAEDSRLLHQAAQPLGEAVHRIRMAPFGDGCEGLRRVCRDLARLEDKDVELVITGGDIELDRTILDGLKSPLVHLVRNAVHHGVEAREERMLAGKPAAGRVAVVASLRGQEVEIVVEDDGRGLDLTKIRDQATARGLRVPREPDELARVIFQPGFTTAGAVSEVSGRGVGLDVVRGQVERLHGSVDVGWRLGQGTRFTLLVPLTLTTVRALLVGVAGHTFAFAGSHVVSLMRLARAELLQIEGVPAVVLAGRPVPVVALGEVLGLRGEVLGLRGAAWPEDPLARRPAVILAVGERRAAVLVDELIAEREVVVQSLGPRLTGLPLAAGASLLASGRLAIILGAAEVLRAALADGAARPSLGPGEVTARTRRRLLVVEDVVTTRSLLRSVLEAEGFEVITAIDGADGWRALQEQGADLLISDVEMPRVDGFELTAQVRASPRFKDLPVILVTGLEDSRDRARGLEVGASAYVIKAGFDQRDLLGTIAQLL